jgi:hypothetical protein
MPKSQALKFGVLILAFTLVLSLFSGCQNTPSTVFPDDEGNPMVGHVLAVFDQAGDPYDLILFRNGNAFATTTKTREGGPHGVLGRWTASPETVFVSYDDGSKEAFVYYDGTIRRQEYYPQRQVTTTANRYEYGWMVKGPEAAFVGVWYGVDAKDAVHRTKGTKPQEYILHLSSDGKASRSDWKDVTGKWKVTNDGMALINWSNGAVDSISSTGAGYEMRSWLPGTKPESSAGIKTLPVRRGAY